MISLTELNLKGKSEVLMREYIYICTDLLLLFCLLFCLFVVLLLFWGEGGALTILKFYRILVKQSSEQVPHGSEDYGNIEIPTKYHALQK